MDFSYKNYFPRLIFGSVNSAGTKTGGYGFTSSRVSDGVYLITFDVAFDLGTIPGAVATPNSSTLENAYCFITNRSESSFRVSVFNYESTGPVSGIHDCAFEFMAFANAS